MNDDLIEKKLRELPASELPDTWRAEILATALRQVGAPTPRQVWPPLLIALRRLFTRNPITAGALTALWLLIFFFKAGTPVDPSEKELIAHMDSNLDPNRPVYLVSIQNEILLAQLGQDQPEQGPSRRIP